MARGVLVVHRKVDVLADRAGYRRRVRERLSLGDLRFELFVIGLAALEVASLLVGSPGHHPGAMAVTAASALVLLGRRWRPLVCCVLAFALITVELALVPRSTTAQFAGTLVTFAVAGAINAERDAVLAWLAGVGLLVYASWGDPLGGGLSDFLLSLAVGTALWRAGLLVSRRGRHATAMTARAESAERDREQRTRAAVQEERARLARELHDVVSHGLAVAIVQTVAARADLGGHLDDSESQRLAVDRHLAAVETSARDALGEMRRMLGLLSVDGEATATTPPPSVSPGLRELPALVERLSSARVVGRVTQTVADAGDLPASLDLAAYRIVQEALTNVVKHAPGGDIDVAVARAGQQLVIDVVNTPAPAVRAGRGSDPPTDGGRGLVGMRERVALYSGTLSAGPCRDGGYHVQARLAVPDDRDSSTIRRSAASTS
jgi:signal transduction histidine kinase